MKKNTDVRFSKGLRIEFSKFEQFDDKTATLIVTFKDCNGDIGLNQADSIEPFQYNFFMEYFEKQKWPRPKGRPR